MVRKALRIAIPIMLCCLLIIIGVTFSDKMILIKENIYEIMAFDGTETTWTDLDTVYVYYMICRPKRTEDGLTKQIQEFLQKKDIIERTGNKYPDKEIVLLFFQPSDISDIGFFPQHPSEFAIWTGMLIASVKYSVPIHEPIGIIIDTENLLNPIS